MPRILGIDPGSRATGFGLIDGDGAGAAYLASGVIRTSGDFAPRLRTIFLELQQLITAHAPDAVAIEQVFVQRNVASALKLGQARGAAICAAAVLDLPVAEYAPRTIKQALTGSGAAAKDQVQQMVRHLLALRGALQEDASDALAVALCHAQQQRLHAGLARANSGARS